MIILPSIRPFSGAAPLACKPQRVRSRAFSLAQTIDDRFDPYSTAGEHPAMDGYLLLPQADVAITATSAPRPNWSWECQRDARASGRDILLMYCDRVRGVSVDIFSPEHPEPLRNYLVWKRYDEGLWLIPDAGFTPFVRATKRGLIRQVAPPFCSDADRDDGIITIVARKPAEGSC